MNAIIKFISFFILLIIVVTVHLGVTYIFAKPISNINVIFLFLIMWLFFKPSGITVWFAFFSFFIIDLLSVSPFGISLFSGTFAMLSIYWLYKFIFSSKSVFSVTLLSLLAIGIYRFLFIIIYSSTLIIAAKDVPFQQMSVTALREAVITSVVVAGVYMLTLYKKDRSAKKLNRYGIIS